MPTLNQLSLYVLLALQALDLTTTYIALKNPNLVESNPLLNPLFKLFGVLPVMLVLKASFAAFLFWQQAGIPVQFLWLLSAGYGYVVVNNIKLIQGAA